LDDQQKFTEKEKLTFPLMADPDTKAAKAFDVLNPKGYANRVTFVIDKKGVVRKIFDFEKDKLNLEKHPDEVLTFVKEKLADKK